MKENEGFHQKKKKEGRQEIVKGNSNHNVPLISSWHKMAIQVGEKRKRDFRDLPFDQPLMIELAYRIE